MGWLLLPVNFLTNNVLGKSDGEGKGSAAFFTEEEQGMAEAVLLYHCRQVFFYFRLPDNILESHGAKILVKKETVRYHGERLQNLPKRKRIQHKVLKQDILDLKNQFTGVQIIPVGQHSRMASFKGFGFMGSFSEEMVITDFSKDWMVGFSGKGSRWFASVDMDSGLKALDLFAFRRIPWIVSTM